LEGLPLPQKRPLVRFAAFGVVEFSEFNKSLADANKTAPIDCRYYNLAARNSRDSPMGSRSRSAAALLIECTKTRVSREDYHQRLQERDARNAADTRTPAQVWLNDPPPGRSALHQVPHVGHPLQGPAPRRSAGTRVDLWKSR